MQKTRNICFYSPENLKNINLDQFLCLSDPKTSIQEFHQQLQLHVKNQKHAINELVIKLTESILGPFLFKNTVQDFSKKKKKRKKNYETLIFDNIYLKNLTLGPFWDTFGTKTSKQNFTKKLVSGQL